MAYKFSSSIVLLLSLNILFSALVSSQTPPPTPTPTPSPPPPTPSPPPPLPSPPPPTPSPPPPTPSPPPPLPSPPPPPTTPSPPPPTPSPPAATPPPTPPPPTVNCPGNVNFNSCILPILGSLLGVNITLSPRIINQCCNAIPRNTCNCTTIRGTVFGYPVNVTTGTLIPRICNRTCP